MRDTLGIKIEALAILTGNSEWCYSPMTDDCDNAVFSTEHVIYPLDYQGVVPTQAEIDAKAVSLWEAFTQLEYARERKAAYDQLNQDELRYDDLVNGTSTWPDAIASIKLAYPKEVTNV